MSYSMSQLSELTEIPARTVRYYIQVGLMDAPVPRGRHTTYDDLALARLRAIRVLRDGGVALEDIKTKVEGLAAGALEALAANPPPLSPTVQGIHPADRPSLPKGKPGPRPRKPHMEATAAVVPPVAPVTHPASTAPPARSPRAPRRAETHAPVNTPVHAVRAAEQWVRTVLVPGLEIHVRAESGPLVERLAREIVAMYSVPTT